MRYPILRELLIIFESEWNERKRDADLGGVVFEVAF